MKYVGLDWAYRKAQWCALSPGGEVTGEGRIRADRDGLARLVLASPVGCTCTIASVRWVWSCLWSSEVPWTGTRRDLTCFGADRSVSFERRVGFGGYPFLAASGRPVRAVVT